jgi:hypothetical protein
MSKRKLLAVYLTTIALLQGALYFSTFGSADMGMAFHWDPRIGINAWLTSGEMNPEVRSRLREVSELIRWASAVWLLALGVLFTFRKPVVQLYVLSECVLSLPSLAFLSVMIGASLNPAHGFSTGELLIPIVVFCVFTILPLSVGIQEWRGIRQQSVAQSSQASLEVPH